MAESADLRVADTEPWTLKIGSIQGKVRAPGCATVSWGDICWKRAGIIIAGGTDKSVRESRGFARSIPEHRHCNVHFNSNMDSLVIFGYIRDDIGARQSMTIR